MYDIFGDPKLELTMKLKLYISAILAAASLTGIAKDSEDEKVDFGKITVKDTKLGGIGTEEGVMRRDPSDVIKVGDTFYVWYSKGDNSSG